MIYRIGRMKRILAAGMLAVVLLSGCDSGPEDVSASSEPAAEEENGSETQAQQLEKQLIAVWNLSRDEESQVSSDGSLAQAADFFLAYVLQNPEAYWGSNQPVNLDGMVSQKDTVVFVYDGQLPGVQVGTEVLDALTGMNSGTDAASLYRVLKNLSVVYGEGEKGSAWLILARYVDSAPGGMAVEGPDEPPAESSEEPEESGGEQENPDQTV